MADPRIVKLAEVLVSYSTRVKRGDTVLIHAIGVDTIPFLKELHRIALQKGAKEVDYRISIPEVEKDFYKYASKKQVEYLPQHELDYMKEVDVYIAVRAPENAAYLSGIDQNVLATRMRTTYPILAERVNNTRWVVTRWPTHAGAQDAGMSLDDFEDFFFRCTIYDYAALKDRQMKLVRLMNKARDVHITASDTDLRFSLKGMKSISCHGDKNIPDGEVYSAPVRDSVEGYITYNTPSAYAGKEFNGVRLEFKKGKIVKATCPSLNAALNKVFDTDEGARYVGEFAIGTNTEITRPMKNILFDEKIFGSIHFTPGMSYEDCDNGNKSAIHWDLVKILTGDGMITFDGTPIQKNGLFVHPDLKGLNPKKASKAKKRSGGKKKK